MFILLYANCVVMYYVSFYVVVGNKLYLIFILSNFIGPIKYHMERGDVYLIFDSYIGNSTKQIMKSSRSGNDASRDNQLGLHTTLPTQNVTLSVVHNNVQLIHLICHYLMNDNQDNKHKLVITGKYPTLVKVWVNSTLQREYLKTNHEEADVVVILSFAFHNLKFCKKPMSSSYITWLELRQEQATTRTSR